MRRDFTIVKVLLSIITGTDTGSADSIRYILRPFGKYES